MTSELLSKELRASLEQRTVRYQRALWADSGDVARAYLLSRGIPSHVAQDYRLGVVEAGDPDHPDRAGWIHIPYLTRAGVALSKFRRLDDGEPKYLAEGSRLYNTLAMDEADRNGVLGICEGEFDAIVNTALVGIPSVGIPGVDTYKAHPEWRELFRGYQEVLIFEDQDEVNEHTGKRAGRTLSEQLRRDIDTSRIVRLPSKDVNDTYQAFGAEGVRRAAGLL